MRAQRSRATNSKHCLEGMGRKVDLGHDGAQIGAAASFGNCRKDCGTGKGKGGGSILKSKTGVYSDAWLCFFFSRSSIRRRVHSAHLKMCRSLSSANVTPLGLSIKFFKAAGSGHPLRSGLGKWARTCSCSFSNRSESSSLSNGINGCSVKVTASFRDERDNATIMIHAVLLPAFRGFFQSLVCNGDARLPQ